MVSNTKKINLIVLGFQGRMGSRIMVLAQQDERFGEVAGVEKNDPFESILSRAEVVIDFTTAEAVLSTASIVASKKKALVIGTTGLKEAEVAKLKDIARRIPIVFSPNMSVGVNILFQLVRQAVLANPHFDIEIVEAHHNQKKDAPSGTAMKLAEIAADSSHRSSDDYVFGRQGMVGARQKKEIGVLSLRAGDIVGDHTVLLSHIGERLELTHRAHSRDTFAMGALTAAAWVFRRKPGLYSMSDVLGFK